MVDSSKIKAERTGNPLKRYFKRFNFEVPLTYYYVHELKSKKKKNKEFKKSISSELHNSDLILLTKFPKPISKIL